jgi:NADH:ubiquinone oxidoreductase subunit B-like Fe-S oxidoreductase
VGDCAIDGGMFAGSYAVAGGLATVLPVDMHIRGCPPNPRDLLRGLLYLMQTSVETTELGLARRGY